MSAVSDFNENTDVEDFEDDYLAFKQRMLLEEEEEKQINKKNELGEDNSLTDSHSIED